MHMFIYNTHFLYPWNGWIKNKILPSRQYTLCLYVHITQYVFTSRTQSRRAHTARICAQDLDCNYCKCSSSLPHPCLPGVLTAA